ncbi:MAG: DNA-formamidopyrimidine glycosylase family protein [Candidatus Kariarchaeaceae archaeon]|jgi:formamidopyrimidine-DNA glycosylase
MSIELPEAYILGNQMKKQLVGKEIKACQMQNYERAQKIGFINKNIDDFQLLIGASITDVVTKGSMILIQLDHKLNILIAPEYGGKYFYHERETEIPKIWHMKLIYTDQTYFSGRLYGMGVLKVVRTEDLHSSYIYQRESIGVSALDRKFTLEHFSSLLISKKRQLKSVLVGKDAITIGLMNSAFQDILYRSKIHPKRRATDLSEEERQALFYAIKELVSERLEKNGKNQFQDLYQQFGKYIPLMGPNKKDSICKVCNTTIQKIAHGGGHVFLCPTCQV